MSEKNREGKRSAREALRQQREKEQARAHRRRTVLVAGSVVVALGAAAAIGVAVADHKSTGSSDASAPATAPSGAVGKSGLAIPVGAAAAPSTLTVYEDFRCPACDAFEKVFTPTVHSLEDSGKLRTEYHLVLLIDNNRGGSGSLNAANAAACAQDQGKFRAYHDVLYANQPDEQDDAWSDKKALLDLAGKVPGLRTAAFTSCVNGGTHDGWVKKNDAAFNAAGYGSTPTVLLNGKSVYGGSANLTPDSLKAMVEAADKAGRTATPGAGATATATP